MKIFLEENQVEILVDSEGNLAFYIMEHEMPICSIEIEDPKDFIERLSKFVDENL